LFLLIFLAVSTYSPRPEPTTIDLLTATFLGTGNAQNVALPEGDPSLAVTEESHTSSQEAGGVVMEGITEGTIVSLSTVLDQALISFSNLHVFFVLLVMESG
jgi:hypothetical protein